MENEIEFNFWVVTKYRDTTKGFHSLIESLTYFDQVDEWVVLWDFSNSEDGETIKEKF
jgi:hypothetical protein